MRLRFPRTTTSCLAIVGILLCWLGGLQAIGTNDAAWHIATGKLIRSLGYLPATDPWSYLSQGATWWHHSWLFDVPASWVWDVLGFTGVFLGLAAVLVPLPVVQGRMARARGADDVMILPMCLLSGLVVWEYAGSLRPVLVTLWFSLWFFHLLSMERDHPERFRAWWLPVLMVVWVNSHGGFPAGLAIVGAFVVEALWLGQWERAGRLGALLALVVFATLANPYGIDVYVGAMHNASSIIAPHVPEWQPVDVRHQPLLAAFLFAVLVPFSLREPKTPPAEKLLILLWAVAGLWSQRHLMILAVVATPATAAHWSRLAREGRFGEWYARYAECFARGNDMPWARALSAAVLAALLAIMTTPALKERFWAEKDWQGVRHLPTAERDFVLAHYPGERFVMDLSVGGYLLLAGTKTLPLFVDGRCATAYPESLMEDYTAVLRGDLSAEEVRKKYGASGYFVDDYFDGMLVEALKDSPCRRVFKGPAAAVWYCGAERNVSP